MNSSNVRAHGCEHPPQKKVKPNQRGQVDTLLFKVGQRERDSSRSATAELGGRLSFAPLERSYLIISAKVHFQLLYLWWPFQLQARVLTSKGTVENKSHKRKYSLHLKLSEKSTFWKWWARLTLGIFVQQREKKNSQPLFISEFQSLFSQSHWSGTLSARIEYIQTHMTGKPERQCGNSCVKNAPVKQTLICTCINSVSTNQPANFFEKKLTQTYR